MSLLFAVVRLARVRNPCPGDIIWRRDSPFRVKITCPPDLKCCADVLLFVAGRVHLPRGRPPFVPRRILRRELQGHHQAVQQGPVPPPLLRRPRHRATAEMQLQRRRRPAAAPPRRRASTRGCSTRRLRRCSSPPASLPWDRHRTVSGPSSLRASGPRLLRAQRVTWQPTLT